MWFTEIFKRFYYTWYPKQPYMTRLELCGSRVANISPFVRNLYILTGTARFTSFSRGNSTLPLQ